MKLAAGVGNSTIDDGYEAGLQAASEAKTHLGSPNPDFVFVFSTVGYEQEDVLAAVAEVFGGIPMSGATYEGIIGRGIADESMYAVQVIALRSSDVRFHNFSFPSNINDSLECGEHLGRQVARVEDPGNRALFLFPDFRTNTTSLFEGIEKYSKLPFIGGLSGDNLKFLQCYQFHNGEVRQNSCSGVLVTGDFNLKTIVAHGSETLGKRLTVTKSHNSEIFEVDGQPALDLAGEVFGEPITPENMGSFIAFVGIGLWVEVSPNYPSPYVLRAIATINFETKSFSMSADVPLGTEIQFMRRDQRAVLDSGLIGATNLMNDLASVPAAPQLVCQFDCAGRGKIIVGDDVGKGMDMVQGVFKDNVPWMGTFSFGEISPIDNENHFHNFTVTLAAFY